MEPPAQEQRIAAAARQAQQTQRFGQRQGAVVGGVEARGAAIETLATGLLGAHPPAGLELALEHLHHVPRAQEPPGAGQAGYPAPDDDDRSHAA